MQGILLKKGRQMGWAGAKRRHFALVEVGAATWRRGTAGYIPGGDNTSAGGVVLLLGGDGDGDLTSEEDAREAMTRRRVERVTGDMFVYLKHGGAGDVDGDDDGDDDDDGGGGGGAASPHAASPAAAPTTLRDSHALHDHHQPGGGFSASPSSGCRHRRGGDGRKMVLETPGREYRLRAETSGVARAWVAALKESIAAAAGAEDDGGGGGGVGGRGGGRVENAPSSPSSPSPSGVPAIVATRGSSTHRGGDALISPDGGGGGGGGGVSRADLALDNSPVPSWELDSPGSPQPPSPGSSWAQATYQVHRPAYLNVRF